MASFDFSISKLGPCSVASPVKLSKILDDYISNYVADNERIIYDIEINEQPSTRTFGARDLLEKAGPRERIYFEPGRVRAAIATCGGLCPGLNDVIRSIVMCLWYQYGVTAIFGIRYGYRGLIGEYGIALLELSPEKVADIHREGGTMLGSSRGGSERIAEMVDTLQRMNVNMLFAIGGDGTQKGALAISAEAARRNMEMAVVGVPKTIDNDLCFVEKSFGFETAVSVAVNAVAAAHVEARDAVNGIGLVKVMGRDSGFIAAHTSLSMNDVNFVLIPEVPFDLDGGNGLLFHLDRRMEKRGHAVVLVAEGAGQNLMRRDGGADASGNIKLADIGAFLRDAINGHFKQQKREVSLKYIDPSYMIRSAPASAGDSLYCARLGANAVHAAMSGRTRLLIGQVNNHFVHIPIELAVAHRKRVDPESSLWRDVVDATGQPPLMLNGR